MGGVRPWLAALGDRRAQENSMIFMENLLKVQEQPTPMSGKWSRRGRRLTWLDMESLTELQHRKKSEQKVGVGTVQENYGSLV